MMPKKFALVSGIAMLVFGLVSLIPNFVGPIEGLPHLLVETSYGAFLGIFPLNLFNKLILVAFGLWGVLAGTAQFTSLPNSILYSRVLFVFMAISAVLGILPTTSTMYGYVPLFGADIVVHSVLAALGVYYGFALSSELHRKKLQSTH